MPCPHLIVYRTAIEPEKGSKHVSLGPESTMAFGLTSILLLEATKASTGPLPAIYRSPCPQTTKIPPQFASLTLFPLSLRRSVAPSLQALTIPSLFCLPFSPFCGIRTSELGPLADPPGRMLDPAAVLSKVNTSAASSRQIGDVPPGFAPFSPMIFAPSNATAIT